MNYNGVEVKEVTEPQLFDPPKRMLVWDKDNEYPSTANVCAIVNRKTSRVITENVPWRHCAEIPEVTVTYRELARWLAEGNGEVKDENDEGTICMSRFYWEGQENNAVEDSIHVRKWDDTEWNQPTREYIGLEDKENKVCKNYEEKENQ